MAAIATRDSAAYKRYNEKLPAVKAEGKSSLQLVKPPKKEPPMNPNKHQAGEKE